MLVKRADFSDSHDIWNWRNYHTTRLNSLNQEFVSLENHESWFRSALSNELIYLYVGQIDADKIGMCRFNLDSNKTHFEVSINLNPEFRGKGLSKELLSGCMGSLFSSTTLPKHLIATIRESNLPSIKLFESLNFKPIENIDGVSKYRYK